MTSRTSSRARAAKVPAGATVIKMPRQRRSGRRAQPFVVVVPEHPSLTRRLTEWLFLALWDHRRALAPSVLALAAFPFTALLHALAWWSGLLLAPAAAAPLVWLLVMQRRHPASDRAVLGWRIGLALLGTTAVAWASLAAAFGPLAGPLPLLWLLITAAAQTTWLIVRHNR
ncbi:MULTISPECIES: hypothetical protein [unclassified Streptomyces]|uniref:hypothetical protein n=1 Tax=unclassified Streptomyces TaxID=2593676 RepID=UPI002E176EC1